MSPAVWKVSNMLLGKSGGQLLIALERNEVAGPSGNGSPSDETAMRVKSRAVRTVLCKNLEW